MTIRKSFTFDSLHDVSQHGKLKINFISFQTLTRFLGTFDKVGLAVSGIMKSFSWNRIGIIAQKHTDKIWMYTRDAVVTMASTRGMHIAISKTFNGTEDLHGILKQVALKSKSKIFVLYSNNAMYVISCQHG